MPDHDRREFLELLASSAAALTLGPPLLASQAGEPATGDASTAGIFIRTVFIGDCLAIGQRATALGPAVRDCFEQASELALLGGGQTIGLEFVALQLKRLREARPSGVNASDRDELAFVLGAVCGLAADRHLRTADAGSQRAGATDEEWHQAAFLIHQVGVTSEMGSGSATELETVLTAFWPRTLIRWHTFIPDRDDVEGWIVRLADSQDRFLADAKRFARDIVAYNTNRSERLVVMSEFYDPEEPLLRTVRSFSSGSPGGGPDLDRVLQASTSKSRYAKALNAGYANLKAASDYLDGGLSHARLRERMVS